MKKLVHIYLVHALSISLGISQNLVRNPSFEDTVICPTGFNQVANSTDWHSFNPSPDYYHSCSSSNESLIPNNLMGFQITEDVSCNAYCGLFTYVHGMEYREYIGSQLIIPLSIGQKYYVSFKASLAEEINCATNNLGVLFSTISYSDGNPAPITNFAHILTNQVITDTSHWTTVFGSFIADSAYQFIILGNFFDNVNTATMLFDSLNCSSYYFVDDICVSTDSFLCATYTANCDSSVNISDNKFNYNNLSIFPNPANSKLTVSVALGGFFKYELYDIFGNVMIRESGKKYQGKVEIDITPFSAGIYFLQIKRNNYITFKKFIINP